MSFTVASYNILADAYINPGWYPDVAPGVLVPATRRPALVQHIAALAADVICLQEVEADAFDAVKLRLDLLGYEALYLRKSGKPDGCATFFKRETSTPRREHALRYADGRGTKPDSGHVALILILEREGRVLGVANTHLKWDSPGTPPEEQWGYRQITQLLEETKTTAPECAAWIIAGDLNVTADSQVIQALKRAGLEDAYRGRELMHTCNSNRKAKRIDYFFHTPNLAARPVDLPAIDDRTLLPSVQEPSDHLAIGGWFDWK